MKLRTIGMVAVALALVTGRVQAQDAGWDTKNAMLFGLGFAAATLDGYDARVGYQMNMAPTTALRFAASLGRDSTGITTTTVGGTETKSVPGVTSEYMLNVTGQYAIRLAESAVAPYCGAGVQLTLDRSARKGDAVAGGSTTSYDDSSLTLGFGLVGTAGLEWRINKVVGLFAEYRADLNLVSMTKTKNWSKTDTAAAVTSDSSRTDIFTLTTGIGNGGRLGLIAFF